MLGHRSFSLLMVVVFTLTTCLSLLTTPFSLISPTQIYWGAYVYSQAPSIESFQPGGKYAAFEQVTKKKMSIIHWGQPWMMNDGSWGEFQTQYFENVRKHGSIPMLSWSSYRLGMGTDQPDFQLSDIYSGKHDAYITRWATAAKAWGHPFFLKLNHEMNGYWYAYGEGKTSAGTIVNGNQPGDFAKAWRHIHDIFERVGATNVTWVWCVNVIANHLAPISGLYPGDAYVDWVAMDGYNYGTDKNGSWQEFSEVFKPTYDELGRLAPAKPIMIAETASSEDGGPLGRPASKAAWISDTFLSYLPNEFPKIKAVVWFNWNDRNPEYDWPIESSTASAQAFASAISSSYYAANNYSGLNTSPIQPPTQQVLEEQIWLPFLLRR